MSLQKCTDTSEAVPLDVGLGLYLKPASKIKISVQLPKLKQPGQSISTWQVMEKLRAAIRPDQFLSLKALKITSAVIKFLGELETRSSSDRALARLQAAGGIKLSGFSEWLQIRAAHAACAGPTRHDWDSFFRDARGVDEMKPGERPDTVYLQDLPTCWFSESTKPIKPSERLLHKAFSTFGRIRRLEIPSDLKPPDDKTFGKTSSLYKDLTFEVYIQYEEYVEFATAMDSLRGKKLLHKDVSEGRVYSAEIKVDFDRTNYLSEKNIKKRALEAKRNTSSAPANVDVSSVGNEISSEANSKIDANTQVDSTSDANISPLDAPAEATLLLKELLKRSEVSEREEAEKKKKLEQDKIMQELATAAQKEQEEIKRRERKNQEKLMHQERVLKEKLLRSLKAKEQQKMAQVREKLRKELAGQKLYSVLATTNCQTVNTNKSSKKFR